MLLTLSSWLSPDPSAEQIMIRYRDTGKKRYLNQLIDTYYDDLNHYLISQSDSIMAQDINKCPLLNKVNFSVSTVATVNG